jgi:hypothetical protein
VSRNRFNSENIILLIALLSFVIFVWLVIFLLSLVRSAPVEVASKPAVATPSPTSTFVLPATWTPSPTREVLPSATGTNVALGLVPTRIYTPRPTSLPGLPLPRIFAPIPSLTVLDLARIMQGESPGDPEAAYRVGWVAKNRLLHQGYGDTYFVVSSGFFGYRPDLQPNQQFMNLAEKVIRAKDDPTGGCLYALSRTDITKLGIPPQRADVAYGEWFFFRTWPLTAR